MDRKYLTSTLLLVLLAGFCTEGAEPSDNIAKLVKDTISKDTVVIFSKSYCPHSKRAKEVFNKIKHSFTAIELDQRDDGSLIQDELAKITGARTVPRVFINGVFMGGASDIQAMYESGRLQRLLIPAASAN